MKLPATLNPENVVAIIDSREQNPLDLTPLQTVQGSLQTGDYGLQGCDEIRIERKSLSDLLACVGVERTRFDREVERLLAFRIPILLVESSWAEIELGQWRSKVRPEAVMGSLMSWQARGIAVHMAGDHVRAGKHCARLLYYVARYRWRELRTFSESIKHDAIKEKTDQ